MSVMICRECGEEFALRSRFEGSTARISGHVLALPAWTAPPTFPLSDEERPPRRPSHTPNVQKEVAAV
jgi:hypothetical protein